MYLFLKSIFCTQSYLIRMILSWYVWNMVILQVRVSKVVPFMAQSRINNKHRVLHTPQIYRNIASPSDAIYCHMPTFHFWAGILLLCREHAQQCYLSSIRCLLIRSLGFSVCFWMYPINTSLPVWASSALSFLTSNVLFFFFLFLLLFLLLLLLLWLIIWLCHYYL